MSNISEAKQERITFIIDISNNIDNNFFYSIKDTDTSYITLLEGIINEIKSFVRLKGYISNTKVDFSLYTFADKLNEVINFTEASYFLELLKEKNFSSKEINDKVRDVSPIFLKMGVNSVSLFNTEFNFNNRIIFFYSSDVPVTIDVKTISLINKSFNMYFDIIFLHNKLKKSLT